MKNAPLLFAIGAVTLLAACSEPPRAPEEIVTERAQARWNAVVAADAEAAYAFETPGIREQISVLDYAVQMSRRQISYRNGEVMGVECDQNRCTATVMVSYSADGAPGALSGMKGERRVREAWIRIDDQWWYADPE